MYPSSSHNCTTPWLDWFYGHRSDLNPCSLDEMYFIAGNSLEFFANASANEIEKCQRKCKEAYYQAEIRSFEVANGARHYLLDEPMDFTKEERILIYSTSDEYEETQEIPILNLWSFISAIGGNLGLFLGSSVLSILIYLLDVQF